MQQVDLSPLLCLWYVATAVLAAFIYVYADGLNRRWRRLPPGPQGWPILGSLLDLGGNRHEALARMAAKFGPLMSVRLGMQLAVVASSPAMAEQILKKHDHVFSGRFMPASARANKLCHTMVIAMQPGPRLRNVRLLANTHLFTARKMASLQPLRTQQLDHTVRHIADAAAANTVVEIRRAVFAFTVNVVATTLFGAEIFDRGCVELHKFQDVIMDTLHTLGQTNLSDFLALLRPLDLQGLRRRAKQAFDTLYATLETILNDRLTQPAEQATQRSDLLEVLLASRSTKFGLDDVLGFLVTMFAAGTDTVTISVEWIMTELMRNPEILAKCQTEMDSVVGRDRRVVETDAERLPFLNAVIKETYRLRPTLPLLIPHRAMEDAEVGGYVVPQGSRMIVNMWAIGRDPTNWDSPETFNPERFLGKANVDLRGKHFELLPFGSGRRMCVGMPLAIPMVFSLVASLVQGFEWSLPAGMSPADVDVDAHLGMLYRKVTPLRIQPSLRLPIHLY